MLNYIQDGIYICIEPNILDNNEISDGPNNTEPKPLASRTVKYVSPCCSFFFSLIKVKRKDRIVNSVKDLFSIFSCI